MSDLKYPAVGDPNASPESLRDAIVSLKQGYETMVGMRGKKADRMVSFGDLVRLGLITEDKIPK